MLVSIIIPTYNRSEILGKALESARVETNKANELRILKGIEKKKRQLKKEERILQTLYNKGE